MYNFESHFSQAKLLNYDQILNHGADQNKKAFQSDAYHPLANHTYFGGYQMSVPIWRGDLYMGPMYHG